MIERVPRVTKNPQCRKVLGIFAVGDSKNKNRNMPVEVGGNMVIMSVDGRKLQRTYGEYF